MAPQLEMWAVQRGSEILSRVWSDVGTLVTGSLAQRSNGQALFRYKVNFCLTLFTSNIKVLESWSPFMLSRVNLQLFTSVCVFSCRL